MTTAIKISDDDYNAVVDARIDVGLECYGDPEALWKQSQGIRVESIRERVEKAPIEPASPHLAELRGLAEDCVAVGRLAGVMLFERECRERRGTMVVGYAITEDGQRHGLQSFHPENSPRPKRWVQEAIATKIIRHLSKNRLRLATTEQLDHFAEAAWAGP